MLDRLHAGRVGEFRRILRACAIAASRGRHALLLRIPAEQDPQSFVRAFHRYCRERGARPVRRVALSTGPAAPTWAQAFAGALGLPAGPLADGNAPLASLPGVAERLFERLRAAIVADLATDEAGGGPGLLVVEGDVRGQATLLAFLRHLSPVDAIWRALPGGRCRAEQFVVVAAAATGDDDVPLAGGVEALTVRAFDPEDVRAAAEAAVALLSASLAGPGRPPAGADARAIATRATPDATGRRRDHANRCREAVRAGIESGELFELPDRVDACPRADLETRCRAMAVAGRTADVVAAVRSAALAGTVPPGLAVEAAAVALARGDLEAAADLAERAATAGASGAAVDAVRAEIRLARTELDDAATLADRSLAGDGTAIERAAAANTLGKVAFRRGRHDQAEAWFVRAAAEAPDGDREAARAVHNRALVALRRGEHARAVALLEDAMIRADASGESFGAALARRNLSVALEFQGRYQASLEFAVEAVDRLARLGRGHSQSNALVSVADLLATFGDADRALALLRAAQDLAGGSAQLAGLIAMKRGEVRLLRGDPVAALPDLRTAWEVFDDRGLPDDAAACAARLAEACLGAGDVAEAGRWAAAAGTGGEAGARAATVRGRLAVSRGEPALAMAELAGARDFLAAHGPRDALAEATSALGEAAGALGDDATAAALREEAAALIDEIAAQVPDEHRKSFLSRPGIAVLRADASVAEDARVPAADVSRVTALAPRPRLRHLVPAILGDSEALRRTLLAIERVRDTSLPVLLIGESGTGKELFAEALHRLSPRAAGPFVRVNAAAFSDTLLLSELFGHERGSFTGAHARKAGRFEVANGGTLFLDEIGDVSERLQTALLRVIEEQRFQRLGGTETVRVDVRLVFATNRDLEERMRAGRFRQDLYHRIGGLTVSVPPLRERSGDIPVLAEAFAAEARVECGRSFSMAPDALEVLCAWRWPGNVRELRNVVRKACLMTDEPVVTREILCREAPELRRAAGRRTGGAMDACEMVFGRGLSLFDARAEMEAALIREALARSGGNISAAALLLGMKRPRLSQMVKEYGLKVAPAGSATEGR